MPWTPIDLAPGLYVCALGALLTFLLRRFGAPLSWPVAGAFVALAALFFGPALFAGRVQLPRGHLEAVPPFTSEVAAAPEPPAAAGRERTFTVMPALAQVRRAFAAGEWPLWNPLAGAGVPLLANPVSQVAAPLVLAGYPFPLERAVGVTAALSMLTALIFTFLFLRRQRAGAGAAAVGAVAYGAGGFLHQELGFPAAHAAVFLPMLLYALDLAIGRGARRDRWLVLAATFAILSGGSTNAALCALAVGLAFAVARLGRLAPRRRALPLSRLLLPMTAALGLAAPVLLPAGWFVPRTAHAAALEKQSSRRITADPLGVEALAGDPKLGVDRREMVRRLVPVAAPGAAVVDRLRVTEEAARGSGDGATFTGTPILLLALAAIIGLGLGRLHRRRASGLPHEVLFLAVAAVATLVLSGFPLLPNLLDPLPFTELSDSGYREAAMALDLALAYLGASGFVRLRRRGRGWPSLLLAVALGSVITAAYLLPASASGAARPALALQLGALAVTAVAVAWFPHLAPRAVAVVLAFELLAFHGLPSSSAPASRFFPEPPVLASLKRLAGQGPPVRITALGETLPPQVATVYGLPDLRATDGSQMVVHRDLVRPLIRAEERGRASFGRPAHPLHALLGVRYVLTEPGTDLGAPFARLYDGRDGRIYERPGVLDRFFLPRSTRIVTGRWREQVWQQADFAAQSLVAVTPGHREPWAAGDAPATVELLAEGLSHHRLAASLAEERLIASSLPQDGNWHLITSGGRRPTVLANGPLVAFWLPAGRWQLSVIYRSPELFSGLLFAACGLAAAALGLLAPPRSLS